ncbi:hypothetical protein SAMN05216178_6351 [Pseudomonas saponiphila]|uniref:Uncharacterized protein n=1 Tax=Pseudomonas saponiphila TaxID=556534 RepID=A0A1H4Y594_9PSED|nr:hypothetical protein SAMN05216178_6351 [Pseudomonas saponiphila]
MSHSDRQPQVLGKRAAGVANVDENRLILDYSFKLW